MLTFADPVVEELFAAQHSRDSINVSSLHHLLTVISWLAQIRNDNQLPGMRAVCRLLLAHLPSAAWLALLPETSPSECDS